MTSFVYFDLGGVVELDFSGTDKWELLKAEIGVRKDQSEKFDKFWDRFSDLNTTRDVETLQPLIEEEFGIKFPEGYSLLIDGFVNRFEVNKSIWPVIDEIHRKCKVGLLTNMYLGMFEAIKKRGILPKVKWDVIIDSSVVGLQKPDPKIFELAEAKAGVKGKEILFIDNLPVNIEAAQDFDWQTFLYDSADYINSSKKLLKFFESNL